MIAKLVLIVALLATGVIVAWLLLAPRWRRARIDRVRSAGTPPDHWEELLRRRMPQFARMSPTIRARLLAQMQVFLSEKCFVGCNGLEITEEMRVLVSAWAALMSLGASIPYPTLRQILIYPDAFLVHKEHEDENGVVTAGREALSGESWSHGKVILSWADIDAESGRSAVGNVIVHEFAHQLDALDGAMAGSPPIADAAAQRAWAEVFAAEYEEMQQRHRDGDYETGAVDPYGATEPSEFFAVAAEAFFSTPNELERQHRRLYSALARYFAVDPREWET